MFNLIILISILLILGLIFWFQYLLSKSQNKLLGLILPAITIVISLVVIISVVVFSIHTETDDITSEIGENGETILIQSDKIEMGIDYPKAMLFAVNSFIIFLYMNIPTLILLAIYFVTRKKLLTS